MISISTRSCGNLNLKTAGNIFKQSTYLKKGIERNRPLVLNIKPLIKLLTDLSNGQNTSMI